MIAIALAYLLFGALGSEIMQFASQGGAPIVYAKKSSKASGPKNHATDVEREATVLPNHISSGSEADTVSHKGQALTWKDLTVDIGDRQILRGISGYVRPGDFIALCGASGAGKTTLLTALSQTNFAGKFEGEMIFDGKAPGKAFKKAIGWQPLVTQSFYFF